MLRFASSSFIVTSFAFTVCAGGAAGCSDQAVARVASRDAGVAADTGPPATAMAAALGAAGLDPGNLPPLDTIAGTQLAGVMETFTRALGVGCGDCHEADYATATPRTRIARKMWDRLARGLVRRDGGALYCDSCHQGQVTFLDRSDPRSDGALGHWMQASYVTPLARRDGATHDCSTCHGSPFVGGFLDDWGAPDEPDGGVEDAGDAPHDLGTQPDLGLPGCEALLVCLNACPAGNGTCTGACRRHASTTAKALLAAAETCADDACIAVGRCRSASDGSADCNTCFSNASAGGVTGVACVPADDPICGACAAEWLACESN